ncbi:MAG: hypothetical protein WAO98_08940 [Alphaproteobacteria bacterium]
MAADGCLPLSGGATKRSSHLEVVGEPGWQQALHERMAVQYPFFAGLRTNPKWDAYVCGITTCASAEEVMRLFGYVPEGHASRQGPHKRPLIGVHL